MCGSDAPLRAKSSVVALCYASHGDMYAPDTVESGPPPGRNPPEQTDSPRAGTTSLRSRFEPRGAAPTVRLPYRYFGPGRRTVPPFFARVGASDRRSNARFHRIASRVPQ